MCLWRGSAKKSTSMSSLLLSAGKGAEKGRLTFTKWQQGCPAVTLCSESDWPHFIRVAAGVHRGDSPTSQYRSGNQPRPAWPLGHAPSAIPQGETDPDMKSTSPDFKESLLTWVEAPHVPRASRLVFEGQWNRSKKLVKTPPPRVSNKMCAELWTNVCCAWVGCSAVIRRFSTWFCLCTSLGLCILICKKKPLDPTEVDEVHSPVSTPINRGGYSDAGLRSAGTPCPGSKRKSAMID